MDPRDKIFTEWRDNPYGKIRTKYLLPAYLILSALFLGGFTIDCVPDDQLGIWGLCCLGLWLITTVFSLLVIPFFRKSELKWELAQYSFDWENIPDQKAYYYQNKKNHVRFFPTLLSHNDEVHPYDEVRFSILTYNWKQHVLIYLHYEFEGGRWRVPLTAEILHMIHQFNLELETPEDLEYILQNPKEAFRKIYNSGSIHGIKHYLDQPPFLFE